MHTVPGRLKHAHLIFYLPIHDLGEAFVKKMTTSPTLLSTVNGQDKKYSEGLLNLKGAFKQVNLLYLPMLLLG